MTEAVFLESNDLVQRNCEKLYLDSRTADVKFVFRTKNSTATSYVTAHKILLSAGSHVFDVVFFGSMPLKGNISIVDSTPGAFIEFLQFFYLSTVRLTAVNIFQVANLCRKYKVNDGFKLCESLIKKSITIGNMCSGYATAIHLKMTSITKIFEEEIGKKASEILKSVEFLECDQKLFDQILRMVSSKCDASVVVDACMAWAKAECGRKNVIPTPAKLKLQLKDSFDRIPFTELDSEQFSQHIKTYKRFFNEDESEAIISKVMSKRPKQNASSSSCILPCVIPYTHLNRYGLVSSPRACSFTSNTKLYLKQLVMPGLSGQTKACNITTTLRNCENGNSFVLGNFMHTGINDVNFSLPFPVVIYPNIKYEIHFNADVEDITYRNIGLRSSYNFQGGIEINFDYGSNITGVIFQGI